MPHVNGQEVGLIGYGLMGLTWRPKPSSEEAAFKAMKTALANGMNFWNAGEFYGTPEYNSCHLLERYFAKYPEDADKVVLSMKGGVDPVDYTPQGSREGIRRSIDTCLKLLKGRKKIDMFECARRDQTVPQSETFAAIQEYIDRGLIGGIALSEVAASTIHEAVKYAKIVAVELELSLFCPDILHNGAAAACGQHNIPIVAYAPLGHGILTARFKSPNELGAHLSGYPRFAPEVFDRNFALVKQVEKIAAKKGCTPAQLAISWTAAVARRPGMPLILPLPGATTPERIEENSKVVELAPEELDELDATMARFEIEGRRYPDHVHINT